MVEPDGLGRQEDHRLVEVVQNDLHLEVFETPLSTQRVVVPFGAHLMCVGVAPRPAPSVVAIEGSAAHAHGDVGRARGSPHRGKLQSHHDLGVVADHAEVAQLDVATEARGVLAAAAVEGEEAEADAREHQEERHRDEEDRQRQRGGPREEARAHDASRGEHPGHVGTASRPRLLVVAFDLLPQLSEHQHPRRGDDEADEDEAVGEVGGEHRRGDQVQEGEDRDLLVVARAPSVEEPRDLEEARELQTEGEEGLAEDPASDLDHQEHDQGDVPTLDPALVGEPRALDEEAHGPGDEERSRRPRAELAPEGERVETEAADQIGDQLVQERKAHAFSPSGVALGTTSM